MEENQKPNDEKLNKKESKETSKDLKTTLKEFTDGIKTTLKEFTDGIAGEFKKIVWPNRKDLIKQTATVIVTSMIIGVIIFGMDAIFGFAYSNTVRLLG